jgi:anti-sigma factor (TIGR02949 family)
MSDAGKRCDCGEALEKLYDFLDGELPGATRDEIGAHLERCRACWPQFNFERLFLDRLAAAGECCEPCPELAERIRAVLDLEGSKRS